MPTHHDLANALRFLSIDAVQRANSGHPGMPMGMADIATVLWRDYLQVNPNNPKWINRDRFVLSNGHGSMLLYAALHLSGFDLSLEDLKAFRQLHSKTPGHPECTDTPGVETTTGPLGQGLANAVGMAIAEKHLAATFNRDGFTLIDHHTYVFAGDGCLMEGVSHEACSLAGTLGLGKLIVFWDDNHISIDGDVSGWMTTDTPARFRAYGWHVVADVDGHDPAAVRAAIQVAQAEKDKPSIICCRTQIGFGAPTMANTAKAHGSPLGDAEITKTREALGWPHAPFEIPDDIYAAWDKREKGQDAELLWNHLFTKYETAHPELAQALLRRTQGFLPEGWAEKADAFLADCVSFDKDTATRKSSLQCLDAYAPLLPEIFGGSADLTGSNLTAWQDKNVFSATHPEGNYLHYGVREFGMMAIMNGISVHGGMLPFGGTFLTFSDYARNALRMAAMMQVRVVGVFTHDSIGLGEDGPTHQSIEHAASLRLIPDLDVWRPCDLLETAVAWRAAIERAHGPTCLLLTRQNVPQQSHTAAQIADIKRGAYVVFESRQAPLSGILMATGSEVAIAVAAAQALDAEGVSVRVISMPCCDVFRRQKQAYRDALLPPDQRVRVAVEAGATGGWYEFVGLDGTVVGIDQFGLSAPADAVYDALGVTTAAVKAAVLALLQKN